MFKFKLFLLLLSFVLFSCSETDNSENINYESYETDFEFEGTVFKKIIIKNKTADIVLKNGNSNTGSIRYTFATENDPSEFFDYDTLITVETADENLYIDLKNVPHNEFHESVLELEFINTEKQKIEIITEKGDIKATRFNEGDIKFITSYGNISMLLFKPYYCSTGLISENGDIYITLHSDSRAYFKAEAEENIIISNLINFEPLNPFTNYEQYHEDIINPNGDIINNIYASGRIIYLNGYNSKNK